MRQRCAFGNAYVSGYHEMNAGGGGTLVTVHDGSTRRAKSVDIQRCRPDALGSRVHASEIGGHPFDPRSQRYLRLRCARCLCRSMRN
jgi:hypothetical protein